MSRGLFVINVGFRRYSAKLLKRAYLCQTLRLHPPINRRKENHDFSPCLISIAVALFGIKLIGYYQIIHDKYIIKNERCQSFFIHKTPFGEKITRQTILLLYALKITIRQINAKKQKIFAYFSIDRFFRNNRQVFLSISHAKKHANRC